MMGTHVPQCDLFSYRVNLDERVRKDHPLRKVLSMCDFSFVREQVKNKYGVKGNVGLDPEIVVKLMFLLFWDNIKSERELMRCLPERLDYLWFLGYGLDEAIPNHSVLSKARRRWGSEVFENIFVRSISLCIEYGLVGGKRLHMDGCLVDADASKSSVVKSDPEMIEHLRAAYAIQEGKLTSPPVESIGLARDQETDSSEGKSDKSEPNAPAKAAGERPKSKRDGKPAANEMLVSRTDPDTACVRKKTGGESKPRYKVHRGVDDEHGVIVATETTAGDVGENQLLKPLLHQAGKNTGSLAVSVVGDSQYGTAENFRDATVMGVRTHMHAYGGRPSDLFGPDRFVYEASKDLYICPAGNKLYPRSGDKIRKGIEYVVRKGTCEGCPLKEKCTRAKTGRTLLRRWGQEFIDSGMRESSTREGHVARRRRKWVMEGSFAQGANLHGLKRSRWRRLWRQRIQDHFIGAVQNVKILINRAGKDNETGANAVLADTSSQQYLHSKGIYYYILPCLKLLIMKVRCSWSPIPVMPHLFRPLHS